MNFSAARFKRTFQLRHYWLLLRYNRRIFAFSLITNFFSNFGQTTFVAQFVPRIMADLALSNTVFGAIYSLATVVSGICMPYIGRFVDKMSLLRYSLAAVLLGLAACLVMSQAHTVWLLFVGVFFTRLVGQGMLTHLANTITSKFFVKHRGKALGIVVLGHAAGQGLLPLAVTYLVAIIGWRDTYTVTALVMAVVMLPLILLMLNRPFTTVEDFENVRSQTPPLTGRNWAQREILRDKQFWILLPNLFFVHFIITGFHFFQVKLGDWKGWSPEWIALSFLGYTVLRSVSSLGIGPLIDRFTAARLMPYYQIPTIIAFAVINVVDHPLFAIVFYALFGITSGFLANLSVAVVTEIYGTRSIGSTRGMFTSVMVFSTSASPAVLGLLLDAHIGFPYIMAGFVVLSVLSSLVVTKLKAPEPDTNSEAYEEAVTETD